MASFFRSTSRLSLLLLALSLDLVATYRAIPQPITEAITQALSLAENSEAADLPSDFKLPVSDTVLDSFSYSVGQQGKTIVMTTSNAKFVPMTRNLFASMKKVGRDKLMVLCEDAECAEQLKGTGMHVVPTGRDVKLNDYSDPNWNDFMQQKPLYVKAALDKGYSVLWTDSDVVWLKDALHELKQKTGAFLAQDDTNADQFGWWRPGLTSKTPMSLRDPCAGFFLVRSGMAGQELMKQWISKLQQKPELHDQWALAEIFAKHEACSEELGNCGPEAPRVLLAREKFVTGATKLPDWKKDAVIYHANWRMGIPAKECVLSKNDLWDSSAAGQVSPSCDVGVDASAISIFAAPLQALRWGAARFFATATGSN